MELQHFSHQHPLVFIQDQTVIASEDEEAAFCFGCEELVDGPSYGCNECKFYLHKRCAELELAPQINHPFHPKHLLTLLPKSPYKGQFGCDFCGRSFLGFVYHCAHCKFDLDVNCALLQSSIAGNFPNSLHEHPLLFVHNHNEELKYNCSGCMKPLSGPIYHCLDCSSPFRNFSLHKECVELPLEINHPYDRKHPLTLLPNRPTHPEKCGCYLCKIQWRGFIYSCARCKFELTPEDIFAPRTITIASHEHPWMLISRQMSFICDFCGTAGDRTPYLCATCGLLVHKNCISVPRNIVITRHLHGISHSYYLQHDQFEDWMCKICYKEVNTRYGGYYCSTPGCNYIAHVNCATNDDIWDGTKDDDERSKEALHESMNLITNVEQKRIGEHMVATEIKHAFHDHNLRLTFSGQIRDDGNCDGCMRPISTPFYTCDQCKFFLHKECAELPKKKRHPFHKHLLTLTRPELDYEVCFACSRPYHGFSYRCYKENWLMYLNFCIRCMLLLDTLKHPSHEHSLFVVHKCEAKCRACLDKIQSGELAYICTKGCDFSLHVQCATLPLTAWYKYERHPLTLTYSDDSNPSQHYCDLCEKERDPNHWFYYCADCDNSLHSNCALGDLPFMKLGINVGNFSHRHPLTILKNIWNCPPCKVCRELCNGQALECKESECNFSVHWECRWDLNKKLESDEPFQ